MKRSIMYWNVCVSISVKFVSIMMCMVALLLIQTSCQDDSIDLDNSNVEVKTCVVEQKVQNLIQQVRIGNFEAYKSLALCYRDGDGVEKSYLNMVCMYAADSAEAVPS